MCLEIALLFRVIYLVKNSRGFLSGNTKKLRRKKKKTIHDIIKVFNVGDKVKIISKAEKKGAPHLRYQGKVGKVIQLRGKSYVVEINDGNAKKELIASALHLSPVA